MQRKPEDAGSPDSSKEQLLEHHAFRLPSTLESVNQIEQTAEAMARRMGFDEDTSSNIAMVTREAAINACKHGNHFAPDKQVEATLECSARRLTVRIADEGAGFNADALPDPLDPANLLRSSGRGVFLMRAMMDAVHFRQLPTGTEITLTKDRYPEASS